MQRERDGAQRRDRASGERRTSIDGGGGSHTVR
jgi:hypothetical protein